MKKQIINYETLVKITGAISSIRDPEEVVLVTVESIKTALGVKGCTLFLINRKTDELKIAASYGLSQNYLDKGPISALKSIAESLDEGPVAIYDVADDPRLQYPEEAKKETARLYISALGVYLGGCKFCPGGGPNRRNGDRFVPA
jgi:signal transduction protein with GAF and PtsI domain